MRNTLLLLAAAALIGCSQRVKEPELVVPPPPTYRGPAFLRGSIASVAELRGYRDVLVSGYGVVVNLKGTGSPDCPAAIRGAILDMMRKGGFGQTRLGLGDHTPATVLASGNAAVVMVRGVIPAGAPKGTRFDLEVRAIDQSSTTSLEDGILYTIPLTTGVPDPRITGYTVAEGHGPIFINPFLDPEAPAQDINDPRRIGLIPAGGVTKQPMALELVTTRPSLRLVQQITERINTRLQPDRTDAGPLATPATESTIRLRVLDRFRDNPQRMLDLISHLFLDPTPTFAQQKAKELADLLAIAENRTHADDIALTWEAMGRSILPVIREHYTSADPVLQMAALKAGAGVGDTQSLEPLKSIAAGEGGRRCEQATVLLGRLLTAKRGSPQIVVPLRKLLDHDDPLVRLAAFDALAAVDDPTIQRFGFEGKMEMAQVRCEKPLIYATRSGPPRLIIFNDRLGFDQPMLFSMWDNRFMLRTDASGDTKLNVFYKRPGQRRPTVEAIPATVPYLTGIMAYQPKTQLVTESPGLGFSYSRIVSILHRMTERGHIDAKLVMQQDTLADRINRLRISDTPLERPDTADPQVTPISQSGADVGR